MSLGTPYGVVFLKAVLSFWGVGMVVKGWPGMMTGPESWTDWQANNGDWKRCGKVGRRGREVKGGGDGLESIVIMELMSVG